jgi:hypothetical protein
MRKGTRHSPESRAKLSRGSLRAAVRKRERARLEPRDLARIAATGTVPPGAAGFLASARDEAADLIVAAGGPDRISPQRRALIEDTARLGLALRALLAGFIQGGATDGELASRLSSLAGARRANLIAVGLDRFATDAPGLDEYLRRKGANGAGGAKGSAQDAEPEPAPDRSAHDEGAAGEVPK